MRVREKSSRVTALNVVTLLPSRNIGTYFCSKKSSRTTMGRRYVILREQVDGLPGDKRFFAIKYDYSFQGNGRAIKLSQVSMDRES